MFRLHRRLSTTERASENENLFAASKAEMNWGVELGRGETKNHASKLVDSRNALE
jgi:hypothetical protein